MGREKGTHCGIWAIQQTAFARLYCSEWLIVKICIVIHFDSRCLCSFSVLIRVHFTRRWRRSRFSAMVIRWNPFISTRLQKYYVKNCKRHNIIIVQIIRRVMHRRQRRARWTDAIVSQRFFSALSLLLLVMMLSLLVAVTLFDASFTVPLFVLLLFLLLLRLPLQRISREKGLLRERKKNSSTQTAYFDATPKNETINLININIFTQLNNQLIISTRFLLPCHSSEKCWTRMPVKKSGRHCCSLHLATINIQIVMSI